MAMLVSDFVTKTKAAIAEITNVDISTSTVDINNCDREPIHTPGAIQPHGVLIALSAADWTITHVSANTADYLRQSPQDPAWQPYPLSPHRRADRKHQQLCQWRL